MVPTPKIDWKFPYILGHAMSDRRRYELDKDEESGMYRIISPDGTQMPLRLMCRGDADRICAVLNIMLDPDR